MFCVEKWSGHFTFLPFSFLRPFFYPTLFCRASRWRFQLPDSGVFSRFSIRKWFDARVEIKRAKKGKHLGVVANVARRTVRMSHHQPRRILTSGASRKRKEVEGLYVNNPSSPTAPAPGSPTAAALKAAAEPASSNRLLAGYMAYEFLTKGTLFGQRWDPARAEAMPLSSSAAEGKRKKPSQGAETAEPSLRPAKQQQSYGELATLLKTDGAHIPGIVNPTQLTRWIQMWQSCTVGSNVALRNWSNNAWSS